MARLEQGENFSEAPVVDVNGNNVNPDSSTPPPNAPKFGPKQIAIAAGILVVIIIVAVVFLSKGGTDNAESTDIESSDPVEYEEFDPFADPYDQGDEFVGFEDTTSTDVSSSASNTGDTIYDPSTYSIYSNDEVANLRAYGYTGDEIEYYSQQGASYDSLIDDAIERMNEANAEWRSTVLDEASEGYKNLMAKSYMDGKSTQQSCFSSDVTGYGTKRENVDYEKCGVYNYQAWIKVYTQYGSMIMLMELPRYSELADTGNIVVEYKYAVGEGNVMLYIYDIKEVGIN